MYTYITHVASGQFIQVNPIEEIKAKTVCLVTILLGVTEQSSSIPPWAWACRYPVELSWGFQLHSKIVSQNEKSATVSVPSTTILQPIHPLITISNTRGLKKQKVSQQYACMDELYVKTVFLCFFHFQVYAIVSFSKVGLKHKAEAK